MQLSQVSQNHSSRTSADNAPQQKEADLKSSFDFELNYAENDVDLFNPIESGKNNRRELEEEIESKRRDDDLERDNNVAYFNQQKSENQQLQNSLSKQFSSSLKEQELRENQNTNKAVFTDLSKQKTHNNTVAQERINGKKAHLLTPAIQKDSVSDSGKLEFSEMMLKSAEAAATKANKSQAVNMQNQSLVDGEPGKQAIQPNFQRMERPLDLTQQTQTRPNVAKQQVNSIASNQKQFQADLSLTKDQAGIQKHSQQAQNANLNRSTADFQTTLKSATTEKSASVKQSSVQDTHIHNAKEVADNLRIMLSSGKDVIVVRLTPEHLGKLEIKLRKNGDQLKGELKVDTKEAKEILQSEFSQLQQELDVQGIKMDEFSIVIRGEEEQGQSFSQNQEKNTNQQNGSNDSASDQKTESDNSEGLNVLA